jgi:hypothetical protein
MTHLLLYNMGYFAFDGVMVGAVLFIIPTILLKDNVGTKEVIEQRKSLEWSWCSRYLARSSGLQLVFH